MEDIGRRGMLQYSSRLLFLGYHWQVTDLGSKVLGRIYLHQQLRSFPSQPTKPHQQEDEHEVLTYHK